MFGFGQKKSLPQGLSNEMAAKRVRAMFEVARKFPGSVPRNGTTVAMTGVKLVTILAGRFSLLSFETVVVPLFRIEDRYPSGWSQADALARWYALGLICLTHCAMTRVWNDALTVDIGCQVYDATIDLAWTFWSMPDPVRQRVESFMRSNRTELTSSLRTIVDAWSKSVWFARYSERMVKGGTPPWQLSFGGPPGGWRAKFGDVGLFDDADIQLGKFLQIQFEETANSILNALSGAEPDVNAASAPPNGANTRVGPTKSSQGKIAASANVQPHKDIIPQIGLSVVDLSMSIAVDLTNRFSEELFDEFISANAIQKHFNAAWSRDDSLSLWYALGLICLLRCERSEWWRSALPTPYDDKVHETTVVGMFRIWDMPQTLHRKVDAFMDKNIKSIANSVSSVRDANTNGEWFRKYAERIVGRNPPWVLNSIGGSHLDDLLSGEAKFADLIDYSAIAYLHKNALEAVSMQLSRRTP